MTETALPLDRLAFFYRQIGIEPSQLRVLDPWRPAFVAEKDAFATAFYNYFLDIAATRMVLDHERAPGNLRRAWAGWFSTLFSHDLDESLFGYLWRSGKRHVDVGLDHRFISLGYAVVRQFCHNLVREQVPPGGREPVLAVVNKMIDFCVLVETDSFIANTSHCDREIIRGIAHQVRNPVTVIGGNVLRLKRAASSEDPAQQTFDTIMLENRRLERMVNDVAAYIEMFQGEPRFAEIAVSGLVSGAVERLRAEGRLGAVVVEVRLDPSVPVVQGDAADLEIMFRCVMENAIEAAGATNPGVVVSSRPAPSPPNFIEIEVMNTGASPNPEEMEHLFSPFYSSKPSGSGFGLPIARLAARKSLGSLTLVPRPGEGTACVITLPTPVSRK